MKPFLTKIQVNKIYHLENFVIELDKDEPKHLILTGKNGSGKTILIEALVDFLDKIKGDTSLSFKNYRDTLLYVQTELKNLQNTNGDIARIASTKDNLRYYEYQVQELFGKLELSFNAVAELIEQYNEGTFVIAYYTATRKTEMRESINPQKPNLNSSRENAKTKYVDQFLYFLSDLKIQEALARNEGLIADADGIKAWFDNFEKLLARIFNSDSLKLEFNYKDYSFLIQDRNKSFKFTELSDGYSAVLDIVADLILKMQEGGSPNREYFKSGIVVIDEIETHLHLELQRVILPLLTEVFPNVQFIVSTHSPFILNSLNDAIAFDLERKEKVENLSEYSYEALAEGYFGVKTESSYLQIRLERYKKLFAKKDDLNNSEKQEFEDLDKQFEDLDEMISPVIKADFQGVKYNI